MDEAGYLQLSPVALVSEVGLIGWQLCLALLRGLAVLMILFLIGMVRL